MRRAFLLFLGMTGIAAAQVRDPVAAEALFREGREAFKKGDWATACPKFAESQRLDPATGTLFNLADCEEHAGKIASAWLRWRDLIDSLRTNQTDERYAIANQHANALEARLPKLRVRWGKSPPPGAVIKRDGIELGAASLDAALPTDPGTHTIEVTAPGRKPATFTGATQEGKTTEVVVEAGDPVAQTTEQTPEPKPIETTQPPEKKPPPPVVEPTSKSSPLPVLGWIGIGLGAVGLGVGIGTGVAAFGDKLTVDMECNADKLCTAKGAGAASEGHTFATVSTTTIIIGSILLAGGIVLVIAGSGKSSKAAEIPLWLQGRF